MDAWNALATEFYSRRNLAHRPVSWTIHDRRLDDAFLSDACDSTFCMPSIASRAIACRNVLSTTVTDRVTFVIYALLRKDVLHAEKELIPLIRSTVPLLQSLPFAQPMHDTIRIIFFPWKSRRMLPVASRSTIQPSNFNGGLTAPSSSRILVYRSEDSSKVLIHELVHWYQLDRSLWHPNLLPHLRSIARAFNVHSATHVALAECYVETLACFLFALSRKDYKHHHHLSNIRDHGKMLTARILKHFGRSHVNDAEDNPIVEKTNIFAYVVCRSAVMDHLDEFLADFANPSHNHLCDAKAFCCFVRRCLRTLRVPAADACTALNVIK